MISRRHALVGLAAVVAVPVRVRRSRADPGPRIVAVLYFENGGTPDLDALKTGLAQMLITDLQGIPGVQVVERERLQAVLDEQDLSRSDAARPETAARLGQVLGAGLLLLGSYFEWMGSLRIDARLVEVETSRVVSSHGVAGPRDTFLELERSLAGKVRTHLGAETAPPSPPAMEPGREGSGSVGEGVGGPRGGNEDAGARPPPPASTRRDGDSRAAVPAYQEESRHKEQQAERSAAPASPEPGPRNALGAALAFSEGLEYLDRRDLLRAREALGRAIQLDPRLEEARTALAAIRE